MKNGVIPTPFCQLFKIHGSVFEPHPVCDSGQTSMMRIAHRVFFFCIGKDTLNCLFAHGVDLFPPIRTPQLFYQIQILLPYMCDQKFLSLFIGSASFFKRTCFAVFGIASVGSFSFLICGSVSQLTTMRANEAALQSTGFCIPRPL